MVRLRQPAIKARVCRFSTFLFSYVSFSPVNLPFAVKKTTPSTRAGESVGRSPKCNAPRSTHCLCVSGQLCVPRKTGDLRSHPSHQVEIVDMILHLVVSPRR